MSGVNIEFFVSWEREMVGVIDDIDGKLIGFLPTELLEIVEA